MNEYNVFESEEITLSQPQYSDFTLEKIGVRCLIQLKSKETPFNLIFKGKKVCDSNNLFKYDNSLFNLNSNKSEDSKLQEKAINCLNIFQRSELDEKSLKEAQNEQEKEEFISNKSPKDDHSENPREIEEMSSIGISDNLIDSVSGFIELNDLFANQKQEIRSKLKLRKIIPFILLLCFFYLMFFNWFLLKHDVAKNTLSISNKDEKENIEIFIKEKLENFEDSTQSYEMLESLMSLLLNKRGKFYLNKNKTELAKMELKKSLSEKPTYEAYTNLGLAYNYEKNYSGALPAFSNAISLNNSGSAAYAGLCFALFNTGKLEEGIKKCEEAIALDSNQTIFYKMLSALLIQIGRLEEAIPLLRQSIFIDPNDYNGYFIWGLALDATNTIESLELAEEKYAKAASLNPNFTDAYYHWALLLGDQKKHDKAIEKYKIIQKINPEYPNLYHSWGLSLANLKRFEEASKVLKITIEKNSASVESHFVLGLCFTEMKKFDEAIEQFKIVLRLDPYFTKAYSYWNLAQEMKNKMLEEKKKKD